MGVQTLSNLDADILIERCDDIIIVMSNSQAAKERFDLGNGYSAEDYRGMKHLKRILLNNTELTELQSGVVRSKLNIIKNRYL